MENKPLDLVLGTVLAVGFTFAVGLSSTSQGCGSVVSAGKETGTYWPVELICGSKLAELGSLIFSANSCSPPIMLAPRDSKIVIDRTYVHSFIVDKIVTRTED